MNIAVRITDVFVGDALVCEPHHASSVLIVDGVAGARRVVRVRPGDLDKQFPAIAKEFEKAAPTTIAPLIAAAIQEEEEQARKHKAQMEEWDRRRREEARKAAEERARREELEDEKEFEASIARWRLAHDIREYIKETRAIVDDAHPRITVGGELEQHLEWAAKYAEKIDPLRHLREDVERMHAEHEAKCERCRERRTKATEEPSQSEPSRGDQPSDQPAGS
jgi:hypothetical protein